jgi:hypothetical protein
MDESISPGRLLMNRSEILLAGLAAGGENATYTPVQVQKLFFLLDREAADALGGPYFQFQPYDYGPFDRQVYNGLDELAREGLARIESSGRYRVYALTQEGYLKGDRLIGELPANGQDFIVTAAEWIRKLSFQQLVAAIYNRYPEMKAKSVFRG